MKIIGSYWFHQMGNPLAIGIVKIDDEYDGIKYYIGNAIGGSEEEDAKHISKTGAKFSKELGDLINF